MEHMIKQTWVNVEIWVKPNKSLRTIIIVLSFVIKRGMCGPVDL